MRALIIGAGIGGLATGVALRRAGIEIAVLERAEDLATLPAGGGFHLWVNSMRALQRLGLAEEAAQVGAPIERTEFRSSTGRLFGAWPVGDIGRSHGVTNFGVRRKDLHSLLAAAVGPSHIETGAMCVGLSQRDDGVTVHLQDGRATSGDVVVGADGIRSTVNAELWGEQPPRYTGYTQFQGIVDDPCDLLPPGVERVMFGRGLRVVLHHVGATRQLFWACIVYGAPRGRERSGGEKDELLNRFGSWAPPIGAAVSATPESDITWVDVHDRPPARRWGTGRVTLLGDAAHAMTTNLGQGASQALEDAVVLGDCLSGAEAVSAALRAYEARRVPRTGAMVKQSWRISRLGSLSNPVACAARDAFFRFALAGPGLRQHRRDMAFTP